MKLLLFLALSLAVLTGAAQGTEVKGRVLDDQNTPLSGATVLVKGTSQGVLTDADGRFTLTLSSAPRVLVFSYVGFGQKEVLWKGETYIEVILESEIVTLDEVVVTGYATPSKAVIVGTTLSSNSGKQKKESPPPPPRAAPAGEGYKSLKENEFYAVKDEPLSTFSIDVDRASYANVRRFLMSSQLPPKDAVRTEELINYFDYEYPQKEGTHPFSVHTELSACPWNPERQLLMVALQAPEMNLDEALPSNIVFLIDVSGSMESSDKLPLLKDGLEMMVRHLRPEDRVSIVVYAGAAGLVLPSTPGDKTAKILEAIENLSAGGSTAGGAGIELAYKVAIDNFMKNGNNRVILATDGDFNVGVSSEGELVRLIEEKRESGVFLSVLGFGTGNYQDGNMEQLADKGNGNYAYIDNLLEARKVLVSEMGGTLYAVAKDVKLQLEFNPATVKAYRLVGYENRLLEKEDFNNDAKDAGEMGAGHTVTAFYEIIPANSSEQFTARVDPLRYQSAPDAPAALSRDLLTVKVRYKQPEGIKSVLIEQTVSSVPLPLTQTSENYRFASAVAEWGLLLRDSPFKAKASYESLILRAKAAKGSDEAGYRAEFIRLAELSMELSD